MSVAAEDLQEAGDQPMDMEIDEGNKMSSAENAVANEPEQDALESPEGKEGKTVDSHVNDEAEGKPEPADVHTLAGDPEAQPAAPVEAVDNPGTEAGVNPSAGSADASDKPQESKDMGDEPIEEGKTGTDEHEHENQGEDKDKAAAVVVDPAVVEAQREEDRKRRRDVLDSMVSIEAEFSALKERLFSEKIKETQREVDMVKNETHDEFLDQVRRLKYIREQKIAAAERWKKYQIQVITELFDAEKRAVNCEYESEKGILRDRLLVALSDKRRKLEEEKHTLNLTENDVGTESRALKRSLRRRDKESSVDQGGYVRAYPGDVPNPQALGMSSSVTAGPSIGLGGEGGASLRRLNKPPHVSYSLREQEVLEDLAQINIDLGTRQGGADPRSNVYNREIDVHTDRGYLFYGDAVFERGMTVDIEGPTNSAGRGIIWSISDSEITIRFPDDKRGTIYTSLLRSGKYVLHEV